MQSRGNKGSSNRIQAYLLSLTKANAQIRVTSTYNSKSFSLPPYVYMNTISNLSKYLAGG